MEGLSSTVIVTGFVVYSFPSTLTRAEGMMIFPVVRLCKKNTKEVEELSVRFPLIILTEELREVEGPPSIFTF